MSFRKIHRRYSWQPGLKSPVVRARRRVELARLQTRLFQEADPLGARPLTACEGHHGDVHPAALDVGSDVGEDAFGDDDAGPSVSRSHGRGDVLEDLDAGRVGPVVEAASDVVDMGTWQV